MITGFCSIYLASELLSYVTVRLLGSTKNYVNNYIILYCSIIHFLFITLICRNKQIVIRSIPKKISLSFALPHIFNAIFTYVITLNMLISNKTAVITLFIISFIVSNYLFFSLIETMTTLFTLKNENTIYKQELEFQKKNYEEIDYQIQKLLKIRHDYKNELLTLYDFFINDPLYIANILEDYMSEIDKINIRYSPNMFLNSLLRIKFALAKALNIKVISSISVPKDLYLIYSEIGILFGNLIDNAIEANSKMPENERYIILKARYLEDYLYLNIQNPFESSVTLPKQPIEEHGYGLVNVRQIVDRHNGNISISKSNSVFEIDIILYNLDKR